MCTSSGRLSVCLAKNRPVNQQRTPIVKHCLGKKKNILGNLYMFMYVFLMFYIKGICYGKNTTIFYWDLWQQLARKNSLLVACDPSKIFISNPWFFPLTNCDNQNICYRTIPAPSCGNQNIYLRPIPVPSCGNQNIYLRPIPVPPLYLYLIYVNLNTAEILLIWRHTTFDQ